MSVGRLRKTVAQKIENMQCITAHTNKVTKKSCPSLHYQPGSANGGLKIFSQYCIGFYGWVGQQKFRNEKYRNENHLNFILITSRFSAIKFLNPVFVERFRKIAIQLSFVVMGEITQNHFQNKQTQNKQLKHRQNAEPLKTSSESSCLAQHFSFVPT